MNLSLTNKIAFSGITALILTVLIAFGFGEFNIAKGSAPPGNPATIATSSNAVVTNATAQTLISTSTCAARIIGTATTSIMLTFTDKDTPSSGFGVFQAASTTKEYDSNQYGCGQVKGYSFGTGAITLIDAR